MARKTKLPATSNEFERQMAIARKVMDEDWSVLRALALGDQHPDMDANELLKIAEEQRTRKA